MPTYEIKVVATWTYQVEAENEESAYEMVAADQPKCTLSNLDDGTFKMTEPKILGEEVVVEDKEYPIISINQWDIRSALGFIGTGHEIEVPEEDMKLIAEKAADKIHESLGDSFWELFHGCVEDAIGEVYEERVGESLL